MTGLADDKDAAARLTSRHDGLHFGGRRDDRRRISSWATLPMRTQSQRAGLPLCSILFRAFFFFLFPQIKSSETTLSNFPD